MFPFPPKCTATAVPVPQAIDAYQVEDYKLSVSAADPAAVCPWWLRLGHASLAAVQSTASLAVPCSCSRHAGSPCVAAGLTCSAARCMQPPLPPLTTYNLPTHPAPLPPLFQASMNLLNVAQSVVIYTGMAAGLLVCTKVRPRCRWSRRCLPRAGPQLALRCLASRLPAGS